MSCGCGCAGAGGCGYGGAGSYGVPQIPYYAQGLGAGPGGPNFVPGAYAVNPSALFVQGQPGTFVPAPVASASGPGIGTVLLAVAAVAAIGGVAWWSYKNSYQNRPSAEQARQYRPRARRPSPRARRVNARNNSAIRQLAPARR